MKIHAFCRISFRDVCKALDVSMRGFNVIKVPGQDYFEVYRQTRIGAFSGCCRWDALKQAAQRLDKQYHKEVVGDFSDGK